MSQSEESDWEKVPATADVPSYGVYTKPIVRSPQDDRSYRVIRLDNGLRAIVVHDIVADKSAASLNVAVGHLSDPDDIPGLAHFCEHLLFMGTEKYPKENEYKEYLSKNGGDSNAATSAHKTNYHFSVNSNALYGALDRFSGFFSCPLFLESCTDREINAVDSENQKNLQDDDRRYFQLAKNHSKPGHVWRKFGTGNKATLTVPSSVLTNADNAEENSSGVRLRVMKWWEMEYCASRMTLSVVGKESLDDLSTMVATLFSPISKRAQTPPLFVHDNPYGPDELQTITFMKMIQDRRCLQISFPVDWQAPLWKVKPIEFISHLVGHEGPGSLHAHLKRKGWVNNLNANIDQMARGIATFDVSISLTPEGLEHYRDVLIALYKYLTLLRSSSPPAWFQQELKALGDINFRFEEKGPPDSYTNWIAEELHSPLPLYLILNGSILVWDWDEELIRKSLGGMIVERSWVIIQARSDELENLRKGLISEWQKEKWYGTEYIDERMDEDFIRQANAENDIKEICLPAVNEYIPSDFEVHRREVSQPTRYPTLLREDAMLSLWHKKDDQFWFPKGRVVLYIRSPTANKSPNKSIKTRLFVELIEDSLTELIYPASLASLDYWITWQRYGFTLYFEGYNHKLPVLARAVLGTVRSLQVDAERLAVIKERMAREFRNFFLGQSYYIADSFNWYIRTEGRWPMRELLREIGIIETEDIENHAAELLSSIHITGLVHGNMSEEAACTIGTLTETVLRATPTYLEERALTLERSLLLPENCNFIYRLPVPNPEEVNHALSYYMHLGDVGSPKLRATARLLAKMLSEPAFDTLRTKEQLGYIVSLASESATSSIGLKVQIQSLKTPEYLEERVEAFLVAMDSVLREMANTEFLEYKTGLKDKWLEKLNNMGDECSRFWTHIDSGYLDFCRAERDAKLLDEVTKEDVLSLFRSRVLPGSSERSKLSVHLYVDKAQSGSRSDASDFDDTGRVPPSEEQIRGATYIEDPGAFRARLKLSEPAKPVEVFKPVVDSQL